MPAKIIVAIHYRLYYCRSRNTRCTFCGKKKKLIENDLKSIQLYCLESRVDDWLILYGDFSITFDGS